MEISLMQIADVDINGMKTDAYVHLFSLVLQLRRPHCVTRAATFPVKHYRVGGRVINNIVSTTPPP